MLAFRGVTLCTERDQHSINLKSRTVLQAMSEQNDESSLNEAEAELYDRQLRLWGFEAQQRMQQSKILFCGVRGLFAEVSGW